MIVYSSAPLELYLWVGVWHLVFYVIVMAHMDGLDETGDLAPVDFFLILLGWPVLWWKAWHNTQ